MSHSAPDELGTEFFPRRMEIKLSRRCQTQSRTQTLRLRRTDKPGRWRRKQWVRLWMAIVSLSRRPPRRFIIRPSTYTNTRARTQLLISVSMFLATLQLLKQNFYSHCFSAAGVITALPELLYGRRFTLRSPIFAEFINQQHQWQPVERNAQQWRFVRQLSFIACLSTMWNVKVS